MSKLNGKVIVVTGGTQGVGEAVALHAARNGAAGIVVCGRQEDKGRAVAARPLSKTERSRYLVLRQDLPAMAGSAGTSSSWSSSPRLRRRRPPHMPPQAGAAWRARG